MPNVEAPGARKRHRVAEDAYVQGREKVEDAVAEDEAAFGRQRSVEDQQQRCGRRRDPAEAGEADAQVRKRGADRGEAGGGDAQLHVTDVRVSPVLDIGELEEAVVLRKVRKKKHKHFAERGVDVEVEL